jgi:glutamyl-tRNA synthetase
LIADEEVRRLLKPLLQEKGKRDIPDEYLLQVIRLMKERAVVIPDFIDSCPYFYDDPVEYDETAKAKNWKPETPSHLTLLLEKLTALRSFDAATIESSLRTTAEELKIGAGKLIHPLRLAVSGVAHGPSLFHMMETLGKDVSIRRIAAALEKIR